MMDILLIMNRLQWILSSIDDFNIGFQPNLTTILIIPDSKTIILSVDIHSVK